MRKILILSIITIFILILIGTGVYYIAFTKSENLNSSFVDMENNERIVLYAGRKIEPIPGSVVLTEMEEDLEKYEIQYFNYENGEYKGETSKGHLIETYEGCYVVSNVAKVAFSEKCDAFPREREKLDSIPEKLKDLIDREEQYADEAAGNRIIVDVEAVDLDGDEEKEYILLYEKQDDEGFSGIEFIEYNIEYDDYYVGTNLVSISGEDNLDFTTEGDYVFKYSLENIEYIDIDNDGIMEILIDTPGYEWCGVSIYKYKNENIYGDINYKASILP